MAGRHNGSPQVGFPVGHRFGRGLAALLVISSTVGLGTADDNDRMQYAQLRYEQTVNDKVWNDKFFLPINSSYRVRPDLRPEAGRVWPLEAVFVPAEHVRSYGFASRELEARLGVKAPRGRHAILVHPQSRGIFRSAIERWGIERLPVLVTPTASPRCANYPPDTATAGWCSRAIKH